MLRTRSGFASMVLLILRGLPRVDKLATVAGDSVVWCGVESRGVVVVGVCVCVSGWCGWCVLVWCVRGVVWFGSGGEWCVCVCVVCM